MTGGSTIVQATDQAVSEEVTDSGLHSASFNSQATDQQRRDAQRLESHSLGFETVLSSVGDFLSRNGSMESKLENTRVGQALNDVEGTNPDRAAALREQLQALYNNLSTEGQEKLLLTLNRTDAAGNPTALALDNHPDPEQRSTLIEVLYQLSAQDLVSPLAGENSSVLESVIDEVSSLTNITQSEKASCCSGAVSLAFAGMPPAEYARLVTELTAASTGGRAQLASGDTIAFQDRFLVSDNESTLWSARSVSERLLQGALMQYAVEPDMIYDPETDRAYGSINGVYGETVGLLDHQWERLIEGAFSSPDSSLGVIPTHLRDGEHLQELLEQGKPVFAKLDWDVRGKHASHALLVNYVRQNEAGEWVVGFSQSWDKGEAQQRNGGPQGRVLVDPEKGIEEIPLNEFLRRTELVWEWREDSKGIDSPVTFNQVGTHLVEIDPDQPEPYKIHIAQTRPGLAMQELADQIQREIKEFRQQVQDAEQSNGGAASSSTRVRNDVTRNRDDADFI